MDMWLVYTFQLPGVINEMQGKENVGIIGKAGPNVGGDSIFQFIHRQNSFQLFFGYSKFAPYDVHHVAADGIMYPGST